MLLLRSDIVKVGNQTDITICVKSTFFSQEERISSSLRPRLSACEGIGTSVVC